MPSFMVASFNIEWMNDWFTNDGVPAAFLPQFTKEGHTSDTDETASRAAATVDVLVGSAFEPEFIFHHAQHDVGAADRYTAIFDDFVTGEMHKHLFLDHILLSPGLSVPTDLRRIHGSGMIHHSAYDNHTVNNGRFRENRPSDHRPVSVTLEY